MGFFNRILSIPKPSTTLSQARTRTSKNKKGSLNHTSRGHATWIPSTKAALAAAGILTSLGALYNNYQRGIQTPSSDFRKYLIFLPVVGVGITAGFISLITRQADDSKITPDKKKNTSPQDASNQPKSNDNAPHDPVQETHKANDNSNVVKHHSKKNQQKLIEEMRDYIIGQLNKVEVKDDQGAVIANLNENVHLHINSIWQALLNTNLLAEGLEIAKKSIFILKDENIFDLHDILKIYSLISNENHEIVLNRQDPSQLPYEEPKTDWEQACETIFQLALKKDEIRKELFIDCMKNCKHDAEKYNQEIPQCLNKIDPEVFLVFLGSCASLEYDKFKEFQSNMIEYLKTTAVEIGKIQNPEDKAQVENNISQALDIIVNVKNYKMAFEFISFFLKGYKQCKVYETFLYQLYIKLLGEPIGDKNVLYKSVIKYLNENQNFPTDHHKNLAKELTNTTMREENPFTDDNPVNGEYIYKAFKVLTVIDKKASLAILKSTTLGGWLVAKYVENNAKSISLKDPFISDAITHFMECESDVEYSNFLKLCARLDLEKYKVFYEIIFVKIPEKKREKSLKFLKQQNSLVGDAYRKKLRNIDYDLYYWNSSWGQISMGT